MVGGYVWGCDAEGDDYDALARWSAAWNGRNAGGGWGILAHLGRHDERHGLVPLVDKHEILHNERDQRLHSSYSQPLHRPGSKVLLKASTKPGPQAPSPRTHCREQQYWPPPNANGQRDEKVARDTIAKRGDRGEQRDLGEWERLDAGGHDRHGVELAAAAAALGDKVHVVEDVGIDAGVLQEEDGEERADNDLGGEAKGADWSC